VKAGEITRTKADHSAPKHQHCCSIDFFRVTAAPVFFISFHAYLPRVPIVALLIFNLKYNRMKNLLITCLLALSGISYSQSLFRYGSPYMDRPRKMIQTQDGNFVIVGQTNGYGSSGNAFVMKVTGTGLLLWIKDYSGVNVDEMYDVFENADGTLMMCGLTHSYGAGQNDAFLMKAASDGTMLWAWAYGGISGEMFYKVISDGAGGYMTMGAGTSGSMITHLDGNGNIIWCKASSNYYPEQEWLGVDLIATSDGNFIYATSDGSLSTNIALFKMDISGAVIWSKQYKPQPSYGGVRGVHIAEAANGNILINYSYQFSAASATLNDICVMTLNSAGTFVVNKAYGGTYYDHCRNILATSDGGYILCGSQNSAGNGSDDACLIKIRPDNTIAWAKAYGTAWQESSVNVIRTSDLGYAFTGQTSSTGYHVDSLKIFAVFTDSVGMANCNDISWYPQEMTLSVHASTPAALVNVTLARNQITWPLNIRSMYRVGICEPFSVEPATVTEMNVYPNPFTSTINLELSADMQGGTLMIYNSLGQQVFTRILAGGPQSIETGFLPPGFYTIQLEKGAERFYKRIIKQ
jgi:hypothetical protein